MNLEQQILSGLQNLISQYETELDFLQDRQFDKFDTTVLPDVLQDMIRIANAKTPSFSNISALAVANFVLSNMFGQVRPTINDGVYSDDAIGLNTYGIIISRSGCVDADTEFCTQDGWKRIADFTPGDKVLSWSEDGTSEFVFPSHYIKQPATTLTRYSNRTVDMILSDDHNMALLNTSGKFIVKTAAEFKQAHLATTKGINYNLPFKFKYPSNWTTGLYLTDNELRLFIAYVADGTIQNYGRDKRSELVRIRVKREHKKKRLRKLLTEVYGYVDERITESEPEYSRFYFPPVKGMIDKNFDALWRLSEEQAQVAADEFWRWDGTIDKRNGSKVFRTTKKKEADLVQFIWQSVFDTAVTISQQQRHDKTPFHIEYLVIATQTKSIGFRSQNPAKLLSKYTTIDGFQYCFTMPNSNWVARCNGKIFLTKNSGKDSIYQAFMKTTQAALELVKLQQDNESAEQARDKYMRDMKRANPSFDETAVVPEDYMHTIQKTESMIASLASTRGGISTSLNRMAHTSYGTKSIFASELGLAIQSNSAVVEVLELFSVLFDMGQSVSPEYKTQESKEESISGMFPNFLGISSPAPFYQEGNVRKLLVPMLTTSLARRVSVVFSNAKEEFENESIPETISEKRRLQDQARVTLRDLTEKLNRHFEKCMKLAMANKSLMFDDDAARIYDDYKSYSQEKSKYLLLKDGDSVEGIEMSGRAFKMGRIAAVWALAQGRSIIDAATLKAAIYFSDYTASHLLRFAATLELKDYEIFINDWQQGFFDNVLPIDQAITRGYITTKQLNGSSLLNFLKPVNSKLEGIATVSYNEKSNAFIFTPITKNISAEYSYRAVPGAVTERPLTNIITGKPIEALAKLLSIQCTFNPFAEDSTNFIVIPLRESILPVSMLQKYLEQIQHYFNDSMLILPIDAVITKAQYKHVTMSVASQLMVRIEPTDAESQTTHYNHLIGQPSVCTYHTPKLFDVSGILGSYASGADIPLIYVSPEVKPAANVIAKYLRDDILAHKQLIIDALNASSLPLLLLSSIVNDMVLHSVDSKQISEFVDEVNVELECSFTNEELEQYILNPFNLR